MWLLVYGMLVTVNGKYDVHVCEQALWARSAGNSVIENACIIIINPAFVFGSQRGDEWEAGDGGGGGGGGGGRKEKWNGEVGREMVQWV